MNDNLVCPFGTNDPAYCASIWQWLLLLGLLVACYVGRGWLMRAIQATIFLIVLMADFAWGWSQGSTPVRALVAIGAVFFLTVLPIYIIDWYRDRRAGRRYIPMGERLRDRQPTDLPGAHEEQPLPPAAAVAGPLTETKLGQRADR